MADDQLLRMAIESPAQTLADDAVCQHPDSLWMPSELAPAGKAYLFASHRSVKAGHRLLPERLGVEPLLDLRFRLDERTGAAVAMELLDAATRVLCDIKTFEAVAIVDAQRHNRS